MPRARGNEIDLKVRNASAVIANVHRAVGGVDRELRPVVERVSQYVAAMTYRRAAVDTGFMREHIRRKITQKGLAFSVGWEADDFYGAGHPFYPPYVEFGTSRARAQPALLPSFREGEQMMKQATRDAIRRAIARRAR